MAFPNSLVAGIENLTTLHPLDGRGIQSNSNRHSSSGPAPVADIFDHISIFTKWGYNENNKIHIGIGYCTVYES